MCIKCHGSRVAQVNAKCSDLCFVNISEADHDGYVPYDMGIGGGDYIEFSYCLDCGTIQHSFPLAITKLEEKIENAEEELG